MDVTENIEGFYNPIRRHSENRGALSGSVASTGCRILANMAKYLSPIHPGEILREEFMVPMDLSSNALANALGITAARVNEIVREKRGVTADTALRLARYFGSSPEFWMNLQKDFELECARHEIGDALEHIRPRAA